MWRWLRRLKIFISQSIVEKTLPGSLNDELTTRHSFLDKNLLQFPSAKIILVRSQHSKCFFKVRSNLSIAALSIARAQCQCFNWRLLLYGSFQHNRGICRGLKFSLVFSLNLARRGFERCSQSGSHKIRKLTLLKRIKENFLISFVFVWRLTLEFRGDNG